MGADANGGAANLSQDISEQPETGRRNTMSEPAPALLADVLIGHNVVLDLNSRFVCLGVLVGADREHYVLDQADMHDLRDTATNREMYVLNARKYGIRVNRARVYVRQAEVVAISALSDVVAE